MRYAGGILITLLSLVMYGQPGWAGALDLPSAIRSASPGDTILVRPGTYAGNLLLDKQVVLIGTGSPVVREIGRAHV